MARKLFPLFSNLFQAGLLKILRGHYHLEFYIGVKSEKPGLGKGWYLGRIGKINDQHCSPLAILLGELDCLRFGVLQNPADFTAHATVLDSLVEFLRRDFYIEKHSHG